MNFSPFSCPIFLGHLKARGRCSQGERVLYGRDLRRSGGTGKAEAAKLPGAGIGPKLCPRKCAAEKEQLAEISENREEEHTAQTGQRERCEGAAYGSLRECSGASKQYEVVVGAGGEASLPRVSF